MQDLDFRKKRKKKIKKAGKRTGKQLGSVGKKKQPLHFEKKGRWNLERIRPQKLRGILVWTAEIAAVCLLAFVLVLFFGQRVSNAGDSMSPAMKNGDVVLVNRLIYNARKPKRGDVIAFKPNGNENAHYSIKRIVGLPGETVQIQDGKVYIDGAVMEEDIYVSDITSAGIADEPLELGGDEYFVLGDNHEGSDDSRMADVGNVKREDIYGKVWFVSSFGENFGFVKD